MCSAAPAGQQGHVLSATSNSYTTARRAGTHLPSNVVPDSLQMLLATGKAQGPWVAEVFPRLKLSLPTVVMQGLLITDVDGTVLYSR